MLQNKIYQNYIIEILKNFLLILFAFSVIAITVRAVSFLDLVVENGYPVSIYFKYSLLNIFGIAPKFTPFSFLLALTVFIIKHTRDSEFVILWTSGVKKIYLVNLLFVISVIILVFNLLFSTIITPFALNKSRQLLANENFNSFLPTVKTQQFSDSFKGFTFIVEEKSNNELKNIFLHDKNNNLKNFSSNSEETDETVIIAENGLVQNKNMFLFNGEVISSKKDSSSEILKFEQLSIDLSTLKTTTIKSTKIQEITTLKLFSCFLSKFNKEKFCNESFKKEIIPILNRRIVIPFYIPILSLCCSFLLIKSKEKFLNQYLIFFYSFIILLFTELGVRYTGLDNLIMLVFLFMPLILLIFFYSFLYYRFNQEAKI